ncbi:MAG TPA: AraC family transcriptional regulator [Paludibacter sp.]|nr:AraC family transcriptional regulator [Paludibacter sp.]
MNQKDFQSEFKNVVIDDDNINFGLTINSVGYKSILPDEKIALSNKIKDFKYQYKKGKVSDEFKLIYITKGVGFVCFDGSDEIEISKGKILLINPNQKYTYYHLSETEWKEYFIRFETDTAYSLLIRKFFPVDNSIIDIGFNEELVKLFHRAIDVVQNGLKSSQVYLSGMLFHVLGLIISESKNKTLEKKETQKIEQAKIIMTENLFQDASLQEIASKLNMSYTLFRKNFKKYTGEAPAKYFNDLRLNKAKQLLLETSYSIKEISFMLQFTSNEHFSTSFKKTTGLAPKDFRLKELKQVRNISE